MPVDHPAPIVAPQRRTHLRTLSLTFGFLGALGIMMALQAMFSAPMP